jgi:hypothetical protein
MDTIYDIGTQPKSASVESYLRKNLTFRLTNKCFCYNYLALVR